MSFATPEIRATRCVRFRFRYSECMRCRDACPHGAIEPTDEGIRIDGARCQNCGLCAGACRTEALSVAGPARVETLRRAIRQERFAFACVASGSGADAVVPCLGALEAASLAYLAKRGIAVELRGSDRCVHCAHGSKGPAQLALHLDAVEALRAAATDENWTAITLAAEDESRPRTRAPRPARRQLLRRLVGGALDAVGAAHAGAAPAPDKAIRAGSPFAAEQRELLQIVCKRADDGPFRLQAHAGLPIAALTLDPGCSACDACFRACPTGALQILETAAAWTLAFDADRCTGCGVCIEVCQPGVLRAAEAVDARPGRGTRVLHRLAKQRCARCDRSFVSAEPRESCPVCLDDEAAFGTIFG